MIYEEFRMKESRRLELQAQLDQAVSNNDTALLI